MLAGCYCKRQQQIILFKVIIYIQCKATVWNFQWYTNLLPQPFPAMYHQHLHSANSVFYSNSDHVGASYLCGETLSSNLY